MAQGGDTAITQRHYNIFLVDNWNKSEFKQITQLTNVQLGNARFPSQYNTTHFTFISDENGINNRMPDSSDPKEQDWIRLYL